jgi:hypothetical protein
MLRALIVVLALANLGYWAWSQGWLVWALGHPGQGEREPDRMARQVRPDSVTVLGDRDARSAMAEAARRARAAADAASAASEPAANASSPQAAAEPPACLELGPLEQAGLNAADRALRALPLPATRWTVRRGERGGSFIVTMGRYTDKPTMQKKQDELRRLGVAFTEIGDAPPLMPGLDLGRYDDRAAANQALAQATQLGARSARVAMLVAPTPVATLRIDKPDAALAERLLALDLLATPAGSARFKPCEPAVATAAR